jgi:SAM-dependent methyltransferase
VGDPAHWNGRYESIGTQAVSWYERRPSTSLELLEAVGVTSAESVIDVGGGASTLVDHLLVAGHRDVTVLDLSAVALAAARTRLGDPPAVTWQEADVVAWRPARRWDVWHDRAVLHFLTDDDSRNAYTTALHRALVPGGAFVIGTFAEDGPAECSALTVRRHGPDDLAKLVGDAEIVGQRRHVHRTPSGADQPFNWIAGRLPPEREGGPP